uniref:(northern house mosquito) hypothetical protein n=2 Tax=Culex pipiens TaxID=7175 RepID=A0A8D8FS50_CULPI
MIISLFRLYSLKKICPLSLQARFIPSGSLWIMMSSTSTSFGAKHLSKKHDKDSNRRIPYQSRAKSAFIPFVLNSLVFKKHDNLFCDVSTFRYVHITLFIILRIETRPSKLQYHKISLLKNQLEVRSQRFYVYHHYLHNYKQPIMSRCNSAPHNSLSMLSLSATYQYYVLFTSCIFLYGVCQ